MIFETAKEIVFYGFRCKRGCAVRTAAAVIRAVSVNPIEVSNPAVEGDNFVEKWNGDANLAKAFYDWQKRLAADLRAYPDSGAAPFRQFGRRPGDGWEMVVWLNKANFDPQTPEVQA